MDTTIAHAFALLLVTSPDPLAGAFERHSALHAHHLDLVVSDATLTLCRQCVRIDDVSRIIWPTKRPEAAAVTNTPTLLSAPAPTIGAIGGLVRRWISW